MSTGTTALNRDRTEKAFAEQRLGEARDAFRAAIRALENARCELIAADRVWQRLVDDVGGDRSR